MAYNINQSPDHSKRDSVALVMSIGTGIFPAEELGNTDAQKFLFFGKHWFKRAGPFQSVENLITLLTNAVSEETTGSLSCTTLHSLCIHCRVQQKSMCEFMAHCSTCNYLSQGKEKS